MFQPRLPLGEPLAAVDPFAGTVRTHHARGLGEACTYAPPGLRLTPVLPGCLTPPQFSFDEDDALLFAQLPCGGPSGAAVPTDDDLFAALLPPVEAAQHQQLYQQQHHGVGALFGHRHQPQHGHQSFKLDPSGAVAAQQLLPGGSKPPRSRAAGGGGSKARGAAGVTHGLGGASLASLRHAYLAAFGRETTSNNRQWLLRRLHGLPPGGGVSTSTPGEMGGAAPLPAGGLPADGAAGAQLQHLGVPAGAPLKRKGGATKQPAMLSTADLATRARLAEEARDAVAAATFAAAAAQVAAADVTHGAASLEEGAGGGEVLQSPTAATAAAAAAAMLPPLSQHRGEGKRAVKPNRAFTDEAAAATAPSAAKQQQQQGGMRHAHSTTAMVATALAGSQAVVGGDIPLPPPITTALTSPRLGHDMAAQLDAVASAARAAALAARSAADAHREAAMAASGEGATGSESPSQQAQTPDRGPTPRRRPTTTAGRLVMKRVRTADAAARQAEAAAAAAEAVAASCHALLVSPAGVKSPSRRVKKPRLMEDFVVDAQYSDSDAHGAAAAAAAAAAPTQQQPGGQRQRAKPRAPSRQRRPNGAGGAQPRYRVAPLMGSFPLVGGNHHHPYGSLPLLPHGFGPADDGEGMDDVDEVDALFMEDILAPDHPAMLAMHTHQQQQQGGAGVAQHPYQQQQLGLGGGAHPPGSPHGSDVRPSAGLTPPPDGGSAGGGGGGGGGMQHGGVDGADLDVAMEVDVDCIDVGDEHDDAAFTHALHTCGLLSDEPQAPGAWHMGPHGTAMPGGPGGVWRVPSIPPQLWAQGGATAKRKKTKSRKATSGVSGDAQAGTPMHGRAALQQKPSAGGLSDVSPGSRLTPGAAAAAGQSTRRNKQHNPWALEEAEALVEGVARCGGGRWADIKKLGFPAIAHRTAVDLKDKWRNLLRIASLPSPGPKSAEKRRDVPAELLARVRHLAQHSVGAAPTPGKGMPLGPGMGRPPAKAVATTPRPLVLEVTAPLDRGVTTPDSLS
jgi:hypothetical protein